MDKVKPSGENYREAIDTIREYNCEMLDEIPNGHEIWTKIRYIIIGNAEYFAKLEQKERKDAD